MVKALVGIVIGSDLDLPIMQNTAETLKELKIPYEMIISSAHRTPKRTVTYAKNASAKGLRIIIAGAGGAAQLPGVIASHTTLPVIGVPMETHDLLGVDSLYSILQMPSGIPVATMAIGKAGAVNGAVLAAEILALKYAEIKKRLEIYRWKLAGEVKKKDNRLQKFGYRKYPKP